MDNFVHKSILSRFPHPQICGKPENKFPPENVDRSKKLLFLCRITTLFFLCRHSGLLPFFNYLSIPEIPHTAFLLLCSSKCPKTFFSPISSHKNNGHCTFIEIPDSEPDKTRSASFAGSRAAANGNTSISACLVLSRKKEAAAQSCAAALL